MNESSKKNNNNILTHIQVFTGMYIKRTGIDNQKNKLLHLIIHSTLTFCKQF